MDYTSYVIVNEDQVPQGMDDASGGSPYSVDWIGGVHHWATPESAQKYCDILNGHVDLQPYPSGRDGGRGYYVKRCDTHITNTNKSLTEPEGNPTMKSMWKAAECEKCQSRDLTIYYREVRTVFYPKIGETWVTDEETFLVSCASCTYTGLYPIKRYRWMGTSPAAQLQMNDMIANTILGHPYNRENPS